MNNKFSGSAEGTAVGTRIEHDGLGERSLDNALYYGIQTSRALENF